MENFFKKSSENSKFSDFKARLYNMRKQANRVIESHKLVSVSVKDNKAILNSETSGNIPLEVTKIHKNVIENHNVYNN